MTGRPPEVSVRVSGGSLTWARRARPWGAGLLGVRLLWTGVGGVSATPPLLAPGQLVRASARPRPSRAVPGTGSRGRGVRVFLRARRPWGPRAGLPGGGEGTAVRRWPGWGPGRRAGRGLGPLSLCCPDFPLCRLWTEG